MLGKVKMALLGVMMLVGVAVPVVSVATQAEASYASAEVMAADVPETNIIFKGDDAKKKDGINNLLKLVVNILLYGLGAAATLGVVIAGSLYLTARDNPQQVARAKMRLIEISIGLAAWAMLFGLLQFLLPGWNGFN